MGISIVLLAQERICIANHPSHVKLVSGMDPQATAQVPSLTSAVLKRISSQDFLLRDRKGQQLETAQSFKCFVISIAGNSSSTT